jgi:hypothetical protein
VLVKWQYNSNIKDFLPRLGAPINHVTCSRDNLFYATCHTDNGRLYLLLLIQNCSLLTGSLKKMNNYYIYIENKIDCKNSHTSRQE